jgi:hypothetical protein
MLLIICVVQLAGLEYLLGVGFNFQQIYRLTLTLHIAVIIMFLVSMHAELKDGGHSLSFYRVSERFTVCEKPLR